MLQADLVRSQRWELYRVLSEPVRLRLLALARQEELSIGELAELLGDSPSNTSRHAAALRQAGLLRDRREGTRTLVCVPPDAERDPVVADALENGTALCKREGSLARIADVVRAREAAAQEFFAKPGKSRAEGALSELGAYLRALAQLVPRRALAVDAGTGDGGLLEVLSPVYARVLAVDRAAAQLAGARERVAAHDLTNVTLLQCGLDSQELLDAVGLGGEGARDLSSRRSPDRAGADAVFAARMLHHAAQPAKVVAQLARLCAPGGAVVIIDYARHNDERMRAQADVWLGFEPSELRRFARSAGLRDPVVADAPSPIRGDGQDAHLPWQIMVATKPTGMKGT
jgi:ArsR family transcriptional regulator